jgi:hypothetical protein
MPKMACRCGYIFDFTGDTTENEMSLFRQTFIEKTAELLDEGKLSADDFYSNCVSSSRDVHPCPECGRLYIESKERSGIFDVYIRE